MLQAMNTGHDGSLSTVHANSPRDALARLETLVLMAGMDLPLRAIREQIASAIDVVVQLSRLADGTRRITHVTEVQSMEARRRDAAGPVPGQAGRGLRRGGPSGRSAPRAPDLQRDPAAVPAQALGQRRAACRRASSSPRLPAKGGGYTGAFGRRP